MRVTTMVTLGAGMLLGGLVFAALVPPKDARLPGGGAVGPVAVVQPSPIDDIVEESLRHAHAADAAVKDGHLPIDPATPTTPLTRRKAPPTKGTPVTPDADIATAIGWRPPAHELPQGVYFDEKTLLLVGPRWVYEFKAIPGGSDVNRPPGRIVHGLVPVVAMGHIDGVDFVRWASGDGWLANDVSGPRHARRRTRLRRQGARLCVGARCLQRSTVVDAPRAGDPLSGLLPPGLRNERARIGALLLTTREISLPTSLPRSEALFAVEWVDARGVSHVWGAPESRGLGAAPPRVRHTVVHPPAHRVPPPPRVTLRVGWPPVAPADVQCVCTFDCAPDDRSAHVRAAREITLRGLPWSDARWRCDRPDARRRWSLEPLGLKGEAVLYAGQYALPELRLPAPMPPAVGFSEYPHQLGVRRADRTLAWQFIAMTDGTLHATGSGPGAPKKIILQPPPGAPIK